MRAAWPGWFGSTCPASSSACTSAGTATTWRQSWPRHWVGRCSSKPLKKPCGAPERPRGCNALQNLRKAFLSLFWSILSLLLKPSLARLSRQQGEAAALCPPGRPSHAPWGLTCRRCKASQRTTWCEPTGHANRSALRAEKVFPGLSRAGCGALHAQA